MATSVQNGPPAVGMTADEVREVVGRLARQAGSLRALARSWGVSAAYLSDVLAGNRTPGPSILKRLGLSRVVRVEYRARVA